MFLLLFFTVFCFAGSALSDSVISPCKIQDIACVEKSINTAIPPIISGVPELGVEGSDPLFLELIEGNLSILKYKFFNTTILGYKNCQVKNIKIDDSVTSIHYELQCPSFIMKGLYDINGRLIILPIEGNGEYNLVTGKYTITVDSELKKVQGSDGKNHISIKNFKLQCQPQAPIKFDFRNLFNGQKDLSDAVHKFAHENWVEVANLVQDPVFYAAMKKIISHVNKYLKTVPMEEFVLN